MQQYDIAIVGGGLAGLAFGIRAQQLGYKTCIVEKREVRRHKVCGEYLSLESLPFLEGLGVVLTTLGLPIVAKLDVYTTNRQRAIGHNIELPLGGIGISRLMLDGLLADAYEARGGALVENEAVKQVQARASDYCLTTTSQTIAASLVVDASGKYPNLGGERKAKTYMGIKYHVGNAGLDREAITLVHFRGGYCGTSAIEDGRRCVCYLVTKHEFDRHGSLEAFTKNVLMKNDMLGALLAPENQLWERPLVISNFYFEAPAGPSELPSIGDAQRLIPPLSGNGMSLALAAASTLAKCLEATEHSQLFADRTGLMEDYNARWKQRFGSRFRTGIGIQTITEHRLAIPLLRFAFGWKPLAKAIIGGTHGAPFTS